MVVVAAAAVAGVMMMVAVQLVMVVMVLVMVMMVVVVVARFVVVLVGGDGGGVRVRVCCSYPAVARKFPSGCHENRMAPPVPDSCDHCRPIGPCKQGCPSNRSVGRSVGCRRRQAWSYFVCVALRFVQAQSAAATTVFKPNHSVRCKGKRRSGAPSEWQAPRQAVRTSSRRPSMPKELRTVAWREGVERGETGGEARSGPTTTAAVAARGRW